MKRIYNYLIFKLSSTKLIGFFIVIFIYQFGLLINLISKSSQYNVYDLIMKNFGYLSLFYCISLFYLMMLYSLYEKKIFYNYLYFKLADKQEVYYANILFAFIFSIIVVFFINLVSILQCINRVSFSNLWSPYFFQTMTGNINLPLSDENIKIITTKLTPFSYIMYSNLLIVLYLFFIAMVFIISNIYFKKRAISFILVIILNSLSMFLDSSNSLISKLSFTYNIFFTKSSINNLNNGLFIISRIAYWLILILLLYFIGKLLTKKIDYN